MRKRLFTAFLYVCIIGIFPDPVRAEGISSVDVHVEFARFDYPELFGAASDNVLFIGINGTGEITARVTCNVWNARRKDYGPRDFETIFDKVVEFPRVSGTAFHVVRFPGNRRDKGPGLDLYPKEWAPKVECDARETDFSARPSQPSYGETSVEIQGWARNEKNYLVEAVASAQYLRREMKGVKSEPSMRGNVTCGFYTKDGLVRVATGSIEKAEDGRFLAHLPIDPPLLSVTGVRCNPGSE